MNKEFDQLIEQVRDRVRQRTGNNSFEVSLEPSSFTNYPAVDVHIHIGRQIHQSFCVDLTEMTWIRVFYS